MMEFKKLLSKPLTGGRGATTSYLTVYSQHFNTSYTISETKIFSNLAGPVIPQINFNPEPPIEFKKALENLVIKVEAF